MCTYFNIIIIIWMYLSPAIDRRTQNQNNSKVPLDKCNTFFLWYLFNLQCPICTHYVFSKLLKSATHPRVQINRIPTKTVFFFFSKMKLIRVYSVSLHNTATCVWLWEACRRSTAKPSRRQCWECSETIQRRVKSFWT